jgi:hypothetical protein
MFTARTTTLAVSALLLLTLAACTPDGGGTGGGGETEAPEAGASGSTECVSGKTWVLDIADAASQLGAQLASSGMNVTQSEGAGRQDFLFTEDGSASAHVDVTYTITIVTDDLTMTLVQTHGGDPSGEWAWQGDSDSDIAFSNWDNSGYSVQNQFIINGTATENSMTVPSENLGDGSVMTVDCSGDSMTTKVTGSPFTQHWNAES